MSALDGRFDIRCHDCGRFVNPTAPGTAWENCGEFGEETRYICKRCVSKPGFKLQASNGSSDPRWCGIVEATPMTSPAEDYRRNEDE